MTPKEKAEELTGKYWDLNYGWDGVTKDDWAKDGALIAVNEIIAEFGTYFKVNTNNKYVSYWQEVKQEIENL